MWQGYEINTHHVLNAGRRLHKQIQIIFTFCGATHTNIQWHTHACTDTRATTCLLYRAGRQLHLAATFAPLVRVLLWLGKPSVSHSFIMRPPAVVLHRLLPQAATKNYRLLRRRLKLRLDVTQRLPLVAGLVWSSDVFDIYKEFILVNDYCKRSIHFDHQLVNITNLSQNCIDFDLLFKFVFNITPFYVNIMYWKQSLATLASESRSFGLYMIARDE